MMYDGLATYLVFICLVILKL